MVEEGDLLALRLGIVDHQIGPVVAAPEGDRNQIGIDGGHQIDLHALLRIARQQRIGIVDRSAVVALVREAPQPHIHDRLAGGGAVVLAEQHPVAEAAGTGLEHVERDARHLEAAAGLELVSRRMGSARAARAEFAEDVRGAVLLDRVGIVAQFVVVAVDDFLVGVRRGKVIGMRVDQVIDALEILQRGRQPARASGVV